MTWVDHRFLFYLKFTQEILCILSNQNKLFSFHLFSARSVTWNLYEIKLLLRKELGARQLPGISVFLSSHHICLPACRIGVADGDGEGKGRRLWTGSPQKQKENSANCTGDLSELQLRHDSTLASNEYAYSLQYIGLLYLPTFSPSGG